MVFRALLPSLMVLSMILSSYFSMLLEERHENPRGLWGMWQECTNIDCVPGSRFRSRIKLPEDSKAKMRECNKVSVISCPNNYQGNFSSSCYKFVTDGTDWATALQKCRLEGSELVSIESAEENNYLLNHIKTRPNLSIASGYWTSGTDAESEGVWKWASTGQPVTYMGWNAGEPNGGRVENCVHLYSRLDFNWNDASCAGGQGFICEKQK